MSFTVQNAGSRFANGLSLFKALEVAIESAASARSKFSPIAPRPHRARRRCQETRAEREVAAQEIVFIEQVPVHLIEALRYNTIVLRYKPAVAAEASHGLIERLDRLG